MSQPSGAPAVRVARVRPALIFTEEQAAKLLRAAEARDVTARGVFSAGPAGVQVWSEPWNGEAGTRGSSVHLGSVDWTYNTPARCYITVYRCMVTAEGRARGLEVEDVLKQVLDLVGLSIDGVRANLHTPPEQDPFRGGTTTGSAHARG
ncbi:MAG TPA: hypothetical protein VG276_20780 [Actinomycetes bacterium]|nr:hypothetical protein [Actinomycetes bacterium]